MQTPKSGYPSTGEQAFSDADHTKLNGIEEGAKADQTKADIDGLGINADQVDGKHAVDLRYQTFNCPYTTLANGDYVKFGRFTVPAGKTLYVHILGIYPGSTANLIVEVYNATDVSQVTSSTLTYDDKSAAPPSAAANKDVYFQLKNTSGSSHDAMGFVTILVK